ncbi:hypothetical protein BJ912DRAFT_920472 [Pholiota molesta]|nr:hypothetical protein BJ912DRAFT_920472 [Pholiota molesta]
MTALRINNNKHVATSLLPVPIAISAAFGHAVTAISEFCASICQKYTCEACRPLYRVFVLFLPKCSFDLLLAYLRGNCWCIGGILGSLRQKLGFLPIVEHLLSFLLLTWLPLGRFWTLSSELGYRLTRIAAIPQFLAGINLYLQWLKHLRTPRNASVLLPKDWSVIIVFWIALRLIDYLFCMRNLRFNVPVPQAPPIPPNPNLPDPFGPPNPPPPQPINFGGHQYMHLPANLCAMMAAVPPAPAVRNRRAAVPAPAAPAPNPPQCRCNRNAPPIGPQPFPMPPPPFSNAQPVHYVEKLNVKCDHCGALHWLDERLSKSTQASPKFGMCCFSGKIKLPKLEEPPSELKEFLMGSDDASKKFRANIRQYNNALAMTSVGIKQDHAINNAGGGLAIQRSLLPIPGETPLYAQLYIYDPMEALNFRMEHEANRELDHHTMQVLQDMLYRHHPGVQLYKQAHELTRNLNPEDQCNIALRFDSDTIDDVTTYQLPMKLQSYYLEMVINQQIHGYHSAETWW